MSTTTFTQIMSSGFGQGVSGWAKFTPAGAISESYNVTSITDNGTGDFTVNWTVSFSTANYAVGAGTSGSSGSADDFTSEDGSVNKTASAFRVAVWSRGFDTLRDPNQVYVVGIE